MSDDIVTRLRHAARACNHGLPNGAGDSFPDPTYCGGCLRLNDAADEIERLRDALANARTGAALLALERKQELVDQLADALWAQAGVKDGTLHPLTDIALAAYDDSRHN